MKKKLYNKNKSKKYIYTILIILIIIGIVLFFMKRNKREEPIIQMSINDMLNGTWYSCNEEYCYQFVYNKENNYANIGLMNSYEIFGGEVKNLNKISEYRYEFSIHHPKVFCSNFGKITQEECDRLCSEVICDEELRNYQADISELNNKKIYIKQIDSKYFLKKFTSFDNSMGIDNPYDNNGNVIDTFKNNIKYLNE